VSTVDAAEMRTAEQAIAELNEWIDAHARPISDVWRREDLYNEVILQLPERAAEQSYYSTDTVTLHDGTVIGVNPMTRRFGIDR
jgi:hypothetical protein